jgi:hypothetical protein
MFGMHGLLRCFAPALDSLPSFLVESGGVEAIVQGMIAHARDKQATQFSLEVHHCPPPPLRLVGSALCYRLA